ncbi:MAG: YhgE/Pip domain-containing protein [Micropruina sp.]|uniref:YhgE/Pip family protein n=1 Tax=Micropruina sp. TaxID=2737536 RepID=UPI0039E71565
MPEATRSFSWRTLLALVLVPVLVAGGFLWGTWNAGDRLHRVEAAVVNLDDGVTLDGKFVPLGRQLSADLVDTEKQQNFTWVLADEAHAWPGLSSGRYVAVVVIPKNFSEAATSYGNDDPQTAEQATITVHTSPVAGVADGWLGNVLAGAASRTLNETLTKAYLDRIYIGFNDTGKQFQTVADAAGKLADGTDELGDGIGTAADGAGKLSDGLGKLSANSAQLVDGVKKVESGADELAKGMGEMKKQTADLPTQGKQLASGVTSYVAGANQLADQLVAAGKGTVTLAGGLNQFSGGLDTYQQTMAGFAAKPTALVPPEKCPFQTPTECAAFYTGIGYGTGAAATGAKELQSGLAQITGPLNKQLPTPQEQQKQGKQLADFRAGGKQLSEGAAALGSGLPKLAKGIAQAADGTAQLAGGLPQLRSGVEQYTGGVDAAAPGAKQLAGGLGKAANGADKLADGSHKLADGLAKGADKVPSYSKADRENLSAVVAAPVSPDGSNGVVAPTVSWVSLLLALALWIGALATFAMVKPLDGRLALSTASTATLVGRALRPGLIVAVAQAIVLTAIGAGVLGLGLPAASALAGFLLLTGVAFVLANHALAAWFGNAGRLVAIAFGVLTTVSAVTAAAPAFFDSARSVSPVSPALDGLRAILSDAGGASAAVFTLLGWTVLALGASILAVLRRRTVRLREVPALA